MLIDEQEDFVAETGALLRRRLQTSAWVTVDNTGARHKAMSGFCTQIGNDQFAWFGTTNSKNRINFLELLRAGHGDYVINAEALSYMRGRALPGPVIGRLLKLSTRALMIWPHGRRISSGWASPL